MARTQADIEPPPPRPRTRLSFPKQMMVPGNIGHVPYVIGNLEGGYLYVEGEQARARNVRIHIASLAILEDLPDSTK